MVLVNGWVQETDLGGLYIMSKYKCDYCETKIAYEDEGVCDKCFDLFCDAVGGSSESQKFFDTANNKSKNEIHEQVFNRYIKTY